MTRWLEIAWSAQGVHEVAGPGAAPEVLGYFKDVDRSDVTSDEVAWCAAFAGSCLSRGGVLLTIPRAERLLARSYLNVGTPIDAPRVGCLAVFTRGDPTAATGHVGFVVGITSTHLAILGGNQANAVTVQNFPRACLLGLRWPGATVTPLDLDKVGSRITRAARTQAADAAAATSPHMMPAPPELDPVALVAKGSALAPGTIRVRSTCPASSGSNVSITRATPPEIACPGSG